MTEVLGQLKEKNLKATPQRLAILKFLEKRTHPTIDEMYESVKKEFPSISLATVYKNVNMLKEAGLINELNPGGKLRYDINKTPHLHAVCEVCGEIFDYFDEKLLKECSQRISSSIKHGETVKTDIMITIICHSCKS
ncbi:Fur family transcriptional regulator [Nitrosophilus alvini]|uniref:Fur family transcriptional regulator n=1 Tax=Nitrosophilus alvini TaxID=2714855 RepID=UPI00190E1058|nr:Fur family transcriptional regulator [Nitrosophilus alvini]